MSLMPTSRRSPSYALETNSYVDFLWHTSEPYCSASTRYGYPFDREKFFESQICVYHIISIVNNSLLIHFPITDTYRAEENTLTSHNYYFLRFSLFALIFFSLPKRWSGIQKNVSYPVFQCTRQTYIHAVSAVNADLIRITHGHRIPVFSDSDDSHRADFEQLLHLTHFAISAKKLIALLQVLSNSLVHSAASDQAINLALAVAEPTKNSQGMSTGCPAAGAFRIHRCFAEQNRCIGNCIFTHPADQPA